MATYPTISAQPRTEFGKGFARRLRAAGQVPGVIYGADIESPIHFSVDILELHALLRAHGSNAVLDLDIEGEKHLTMVKHVDQNVLTLNADHVDLLAIKRGEKVEVEVPVALQGETAPGTTLIQDADTVLVEADVLSIPEEIAFSVEGLEVDAKVLAGDLSLPANTTLVADPEFVIATVSFEEVAEEPEESAEGEAAESAEAEGEE
ncbi:50S ribosomal protein L25/general stress protein Ctc [Corynebacterium pseudotuberculosis]|uniref:Large ribosomal subunit protein bL25 n=2 Tax=Corynebacterium pseudotuberculosis TaxID=1719 RepID=D9Q9F7_CORP2|nr:50S ribosomal protein L25/general stress protein Ctc [Corynebacterium pseudotuberculosis]AER68768.1 50S ribosomal protein L25 [Corynebacterium pseudotuberculosis 1/06-A]ADK28496.1 50S ribosomal protein L25/general stress protein Ctc [Corynebacterium pseudotuberculosis FRC41]ADL10183.1 50S ribosomal protein L25/general stress protein Ctc [Corynebacterium pseudotuberculosis C231]ADL20593.1 50S ribosomal protein L25/general stress protein Ctc [Corynebacterium pseudotuberculosis 1002]ADO25975.1